MPSPVTLATDDYARLIVAMVKLRKECGLTQEAIAKALGKPQSYVAKTERRERRMDILEFVRFARAMGFEPEEALRRILVRGPAEGPKASD